MIVRKPIRYTNISRLELGEFVIPFDKLNINHKKEEKTHETKIPGNIANITQFSGIDEIM
jgi:hypothetical protein